MSEIERLLSPNTVAVIGASTNPQKLGYTLLKNVLDYNFSGEVFPINPKADSILDLKAFPSVSAVGKPINVALISIPGPAVLTAAQDCADSGVGFAVILSSGFGEAGFEGKEAQEALSNIARNHHIHFVGPNCMGIYNNPDNFNGTYFWELPRRVGNVSFVSQSGAYGGIMFNQLRERGMGVSKFVSVGNMADLHHGHFLEYMAEDDATEVIALFVEGVKEPGRMLEGIRACVKKKPVVVFKAGRRTAGVRAALSHTGSIAGDYQVFRSAMESAGAVVCEESLEFFDTLEALSANPGTLPRNSSLAIMTISGGPCVVAGDLAEEVGLKVPELDDKTQAGLKELTPVFSATSNPVDMTPQVNPENYGECVDTVMKLSQIDGCIAINVGLDSPLFSGAFIAAKEKYDKPVVSFTIDTPEITKAFHEEGIPIFPTPERAVRAYRGLYEAGRMRRRIEELVEEESEPLHSNLFEGILERGFTGPLDEYSAKLILKDIGIKIASEEVISDLEGALEFANRTNFPLALKIHSPGITHKTESGGVKLGISDEAGLKRAFWELKGKFGADSEILAAKMITGGVEVFIGAKVDETFGPVVTFGLGGTAVELFGDVSLRLCPVSLGEALAMVKEIRTHPLLTGFRGSKPCKLSAIAEAISRVSRLMVSYRQISEMDINPLIARAEGLTAVDALMVLK